MHEKKLEKILFFLTAGALVTPLIAWPSPAPDYTLVRTLFFFLLVEGAVFTYLLLLRKDRGYAFRLSPLSILVGIFFLLNTLSFLMSGDMGRSFWGTLNRSMDTGLLALLHYGGSFFLLVVMLWRPAFRALFERTILWVGFLAALFATVQFFFPSGSLSSSAFGGVSRIQGTLANPITLAAFLCMAAFFILQARGGEAAGRKRVLSTLAMALSLFAMIASGSRGPFLGLVAAALFLAVWGAVMREWKLVRLIAAAAIVGTLCFALLAVLRSDLQGDPVSRLSSLSADGGVTNRLHTWQIALAGISQKPFLGWGQEGFAYLFDRNYDPTLLTSVAAEVWWDRAHNTYLDIAASSGILAAALFVAVLTAGFFAAVKRRPLLAAGFVFYAVAGLTFFDAQPTWMMLFALLAYADTLAHAEDAAAPRGFTHIGEAAAHMKERIWGSGIGGSKLLAGGAIALGVVMAGSSAIFINIVRANYFQNGIGSVPYEEGIVLLRKAVAVPVPATLKDEIRYDGANFVLDARHSGAIPDERVPEDILFVYDEMLAAGERHPFDTRINLIIAQLSNVLYQETGDGEYLQDAARYGRQAEISSPGRQQVFYEQAQTLFLSGDTEGALRRLREIVSLNPDFPGAYFTLGVGYLAAGDEARAFENIERAWERGYPYVRDDAANWLAVAWAYYDHGDLGRVSEIYAGLLNSDPKNIDYLRMLAATYAEAGRFDEAIETARRVFEVDPAAKVDVERFINQIETDRLGLLPSQ